MNTFRYAAIDIGTVTCRLLVADVKDGVLTVLHRGYAITNLGEGVDANGYLKHDAMERVEAQIARFRTIIDGYEVAGAEPVRVVAMATSASRDAENADEFVALLARHGVHLSVIPGEKEAALTFLGASSAFSGEHLLVADIGGGSTELIVGTSGCEPQVAHSFNIGCRRVTEKFFRGDPPSEVERAQADAWLRPQFASFFADLQVANIAIDRMVAVAGTATTVVSVKEAMDPYDSSRVHGAVVEKAALDEVYRRLASISLAQRRTIVGLDPGRAPVIVAGMIILEALLSLADRDSFTVSESDILQGIILDDVRSRV